MKIYRDVEAKECLDHIEKWLNGYYKDKPPKGLPILGFFRSSPYLWTAFKFEYVKNEWVLIKRENIQHEGYCRKWLKISEDEKIEERYKR